MTISIIEKWRKQIDEEKEYTRSELGKMLTEVFKEIRENSKGEKKTRMKVYSKGGDGGEEKKKRKLDSSTNSTSGKNGSNIDTTKPKKCKTNKRSFELRFNKEICSRT